MFKSVQLVRGSSFRNNLLQNPYFKETFRSDIRTRSATRPLTSKSDNDIISDQSKLVAVDETDAKESTSSDNVTADLVVIAVDKTGDTSELKPKKTVSFHSFSFTNLTFSLNCHMQTMTCGVLPSNVTSIN